MRNIYILVTICVAASSINFPLESGRIGNRMVVMDSTGARVKLACVNWYGAHMEDMVVNGLDAQTMDFISAKIAELGFNCVRLPFALDTLFLNPVVPDNRLVANPDLIGKTAMEIFDKTVESLTDHGLLIILNNHMSTAMWCCSSSDGEGLWFTDEYPTAMFEEGLLQIVLRYLDNPLVVGMDLRNELRPANGVLAAWGNGDFNDWAAEAQVIGNRILEINPDILIFVEGILSAGNLIGALTKKVELTNPSKLVYSGHIYPFSPIISDLPYDLFKLTMHTMQTFVADAGFNYSAPYWMGEFGTGSNSEKWQHIVQFLQETDHDWAYWSIDGYKYPGEEESYGILESDYSTIRHPWKLEQLQSIIPILGDLTKK
ncbi:uncharacterized protein LOC111709274 [Eurytemora carolleeae]|uniref:uncharacterized protein LOC111709274 n=1 Tax=Eurytemora carolleeae TaxID=1294199 RepID=UPI000C794D4F|nr:uncharacterized protein LOC111709274 [Eurytemora carolleeae]|eukprot:XP_023338666.1 uncharacterized protein LOC111709274 [Eurytemora affinis]